MEAPLLRDFKKDLKFSFGHVTMVASNTHSGTSSTYDVRWKCRIVRVEMAVKPSQGDVAERRDGGGPG